MIIVDISVFYTSSASKIFHHKQKVISLTVARPNQSSLVVPRKRNEFVLQYLKDLLHLL